MIEYLFSAVIALVSAIIGGVFTMLATTHAHKLQRKLQTEHDKEIASRVRTLLSIEIDENLNAFAKFDAGINESRLVMGGASPRNERPEQLSNVPLATPKRLYWDALTGSIPMALSSEEIRSCHEFHWNLEELTRLKGLPHESVGIWHNLMEQSIARIKHINNPLR